jgi:pyrroline-5-carboxylate reductase
MPATLKIGFIGAGKMASALAKGFIGAGLASPKDILASDPIESSRTGFAAATGAETTAFNPDVLRSCDVIILSVKPSTVPSVLKELASEFKERHLLVSIAAGVTLASLEAVLPSGTRIVRVMPNTPALVGASASAFSAGRAVQAGDAALVEKLLCSVGIAHQLPEPLLDAVTGLSGSGPAYVYLFIEALSDGGVAAGLPRELATRLAAQTVLGAARMVLETGMHPGALKDMVTSPGGTTIQGLHELEQGRFRGTVITAVRAASEKSRQLGQKAAAHT